jgi:predicted phosphodiesterase
MEKPRLAFGQDGKFTIVQFTDIHWRNGEAKDMASRRLMELVLEAERPDLVVFTGDVIDSTHCVDARQSFRDAVLPAERAGVPWAAVFGNHDTEAQVSRSELMDVVLEHRFTVAERGPADIDGVGNYRLSVAGREGGEAAAELYFLDSGSYSPLPHVAGYDWIRKSQIDWYVRLAAERKRRRGGDAGFALAFFHIPLPEYDEVWEREVCVGHKHEAVCCPRLNSGLFARMVEAGDVAGIFVGHDHTNDYCGTKAGIRLLYGRATGYNTYGREGFARGARVIRLTEGKREFETWARLDDGTALTVPPVHRPAPAD